MLAGLASCGEPVLAPTERPNLVQSGVPNPQAPWAMPYGAQQVTVTRTTEMFEKRNGIRVRKSGRVKVSRLARGRAVARAGVRPLAERAASGPTTTIDLPPIGLDVEARWTGAAQSTPWRKRNAVLGAPGVEVETEGVGDAPASTLKYYRNGALARVVTQSYRRTATRWELVRRETTTPDGSYRDVVTVERPAAALSVSAAFGNPLTGGEGADPLPNTLPNTWAAIEEDCNPCKALREARNAAFESFLWEDAVAIALCAFTPPPADVLVCVTAALKVMEEYSKFVRSDNAYDRCAANPPPCPKEVPPPPPPPTSSGGGERGAGDAGGVCHYEVWYDRNTGEILDAILLYCEAT